MEDITLQWLILLLLTIRQKLAVQFCGIPRAMSHLHVALRWNKVRKLLALMTWLSECQIPLILRISSLAWPIAMTQLVATSETTFPSKNIAFANQKQLLKKLWQAKMATKIGCFIVVQRMKTILWVAVFLNGKPIRLPRNDRSFENIFTSFVSSFDPCLLVFVPLLSEILAWHRKFNTFANVDPSFLDLLFQIKFNHSSERNR